MSKITQQQLKQHEKAEELLWGSDRKLTVDEVAFCLEHWDPRAASGKHVAKNEAYFTPMVLERDAGMYVGGDGRRVVDIGAGTGRLAYDLPARKPIEFTRGMNGVSVNTLRIKRTGEHFQNVQVQALPLEKE
jgi:ubiquinone/menaquinone biosynthesis C-methylase UbiE